MNQEIQVRPQSSVPDQSDPFFGHDGVAQPQAHGLAAVHRLLRHRYKWCLLLAVVLGASGVIAGYKLPKPQWACKGLVQVSFMVAPIMSQVDPQSGGAYESNLQSQMAQLRSGRVIQLAMDSDEWRAVAPGRKHTDPEALADFGDSLLITRAGGEYIQVTFTDPEQSVALAGTKRVLAAFKAIAVDDDIQKRTTADRARQELLQQRIGERNVTIARINSLAKDDLRPVWAMKQQELAGTENDIRVTEVQLAAMPETSGRGADTRPARRAEDLTVEEIALRDPRVEARLRERDLAEAALGRLRRLNIGTAHSQWQIAQADLDQKQKSLDDMTAQWRKSMKENPQAIQQEDPALATRKQYESRLAKLKQQADTLNREIHEIGDNIALMDQLKLDERKKTSEIESIQNRITQIDTESKNLPRITVGDPERPLPARDLRVQMACVGGTGGFFLGFLIVLVISAADRRLRSPDDVRDGASQLTLLGVLPNLPENLADPEQAAIAAHCVHQIRTLLQINTRAPKHNVFSITSPAAGTGKTSLTLSLGVSFAAGKSKTLIIDCDLIGGGLTTRVHAIIRRKIGLILRQEGVITQEQLETALRAAHDSRKRLGEVMVDLGYITPDDVRNALAIQEQAPIGVLDALSGEKLEDCIAETGIPNLAILPLGAARPGDVSKLSPVSIRALLDRAREQFDTVVIDTGPVPGSLEASVAAAAADGVVLVVSRGEHRPMAEKSIQHLHDIGARVAGLVFNRARYYDVELSTTNSRASTMARSQRRASVDEHAVASFGPMAQAVTKADPDSEAPDHTHS